MRDQIHLLLALYRQPVRAASRIIDEGRIWFAVCTAIVALAGMQFGTSGAIGRYVQPNHAAVEQDVAQDAAPSTHTPRREHPDTAIFAQALAPSAILKFLAALALAFVPVVVLVITLNRSHESFAVMLRKDWLPLLNCLLLAAAAAYLPVAVVTTGLTFARIPGTPILIVAGLGHLYFLFLGVCCVRTMWGTSFGIATLATGLGCVAMLAGAVAFGMLGRGMYYFTSPWLLYYAWIFFGNSTRSLGDGLRSRQHLRRQLDLATINPRDSDAHYQLGLIYQERRQFDEAKARFKRAIEIDATEADPAFQLGRIAIEEGQPAEAIIWLRKAAALNDKCCSHEVWRELGVAYLQSGLLAEAHDALDEYVRRRPYDPAGLYWQGKTLAALERLEEARESLRGCEESVDTMPPHLRRQHGKWKSLASTELRRIEKMKSPSWAKAQSRAASSEAAIDNLD
jgi:hypothetical protein